MRRCAALCLALLGTTAWLPAQQLPIDTDLRIRGAEVRELDAIEARLIGIEQGDNDFRAQTPALQRTTARPTAVDSDQRYRQKLAMYGGATLTAPQKTPKTADTKPDRETDEGGGSSGAVIALVIAVIAALGLLIAGLRRAPE